TIDNDLPLAVSKPNVGVEPGRGRSLSIVLGTWATRTTQRWYVIVSMGRAAGHLALGIGKAAAATLTVIPEEFSQRQVNLDDVCDIVIGSIIKRITKGAPYGVAVLAEGLLESIGERGLGEIIASGPLGRYGRTRPRPPR